MNMLLDAEMPRSRVAVLLEAFARLDDDRDPGRVHYPLPEVLLLLTCATIADYDDFDDIIVTAQLGSVSHPHSIFFCVQIFRDKAIYF